MKLYNKFLLTLLLASCSLLVSASNRARIEHRIIAGYNFGATAPLPLPSEVRSILGYWPQFTPQLGYSLTYNYNIRWALQAGIILESKGMGVQDKVKYMYTDVMIDGDNVRGYFSGKNETRVKISYLTVPISAIYYFDDKWQINAGGYVSYRSSSEFSGTVWDGYLRQTDDKNIVTSTKINLESKGGATFDFGKEMRNFDAGLTLGSERTINDRLGIYAKASYGLVSIFPSKFTGIDMKMRNIYVALGITYKL